jgi:hypothetical protein
MVRMVAKSSSLNDGSESFNSGNWLPSCRNAEDKFNVRIFPSICEFALQLLLNGLVQESQEIAVSARTIRVGIISNLYLGLQSFNILY